MARQASRFLVMQRSLLPLADETAVFPVTCATGVFKRIASAPFMAFVPIPSRVSHFTSPANKLTAVLNAAFHPSLSTNHLLTSAFKPHSTLPYRAF